MARHRMEDGEKYIEADNGYGWVRKVKEDTSLRWYELRLGGVRYELDKHRAKGIETGWYLSSFPMDRFTGVFCGRNLLAAVDEASWLIDEKGED